MIKKTIIQRIRTKFIIKNKRKQMLRVKLKKIQLRK
jgi:hypothetical protein